MPRALVCSSPLESHGGLRVLAGRRCCAGAVVVRRAQLHTEEKIFTGVVDTWRVGINQQYLYSSGEYLIFAWLFQKKKVACRGRLTGLESARFRLSLLAAREQHY